jgi:chromosome segregation ATPase
MTPEERFERIEQQIEFIVNQQAQFSADLQQEREERKEREALLQKQIDQSREQIHEINAAIVGLAGMMGELSKAQKITNAKLAEVAEGLKRLEAKGTETEERLNAFIVIVERYITRRENGQGNGGS